MLSNKKAFTLIELLVVVLIIGILAAVAVPQYQVAVGKSKLVRLFPIMRAIRQAEIVYHLSTGDYIDDFESLDIQMPGGKLEGGSNKHYDYNGFSCYFHNTDSLYCVQSGLPKLEIYWAEESFVCWAAEDDLLTHKMCRALTGKTTADVGTTGYFIN